MRVPLTVNDFLDRAELVYGERVGIVDEPDQPAPSWGALTWNEVARRARAQAAGLDALGLARGERVAVVSHNSARLFTSFFGVSGWGRVLVPINFRLNAEEIAYIVDHSGASVLLVDPELEDALKGVDAKFKFVIGAEADAELYADDVDPEPWADPDENTTATINYTSGTTARPKGVQLTHRNIWLNATTFGWHTTVNDRDVLLHTLPMFHCNGWGMPYAVTGMGGRHIVLRKVDGAEILRRVRDHGVTLMCGAPAVVAAILDAAQEWDGPIPGRGTTRIVVAGAPPPTRTIERVRDRARLGVHADLRPHRDHAAAHDQPHPRGVRRARSERSTRRALGRAGAPALGVAIRVDAEGEVLARGNHVMDGYWEQPEETAKAIADGWFHTGDGGFVDDANYLSIADRKKDVIISGGENVSSIEVEDCIFYHPAVAEVAVIGVPDEKWGEAVKALVVLAPGASATEQDIIDHCRGKLAHYKCPKSVEFRDVLARTATGKLQKFKLREEYWQGRDRQVN